MKYTLLWSSAAAGVVLHLGGLGWDVYLHSKDSTLAAREGVITLDNPSHILVLVGMALTGAAVLGVALSWMYDRGFGGSGLRGLVFRSAVFPSVALMAAGSIWLASLAEDEGGHAHTEAAATDDHDHAAQPLVSAGAGAAADEHKHEDTADPMGEGNAHTHGTEVAVTPAQLAAANSFVTQVKASTAKYEDIRVAMADGYTQITQDLPGIAAHFIKPAYTADASIMDPTKPEFLLYTKRLDGNWRLVGAMFYGGPGTGPAPSYFGPLDAWHLHENLCFAASGVKSVGSQAECNGLFVRKTNWQLHVWTVEDAEGVFAHDYKKIAPGPFPGATRRADQEFAVRAP